MTMLLVNIRDTSFDHSILGAGCYGSDRGREPEIRTTAAARLDRENRESQVLLMAFSLPQPIVELGNTLAGLMPTEMEEGLDTAEIQSEGGGGSLAAGLKQMEMVKSMDSETVGPQLLPHEESGRGKSRISGHKSGAQERTDGIPSGGLRLRIRESLAKPVANRRWSDEVMSSSSDVFDRRNDSSGRSLSGGFFDSRRLGLPPLSALASLMPLRDNQQLVSQKGMGDSAECGIREDGETEETRARKLWEEGKGTELGSGALSQAGDDKVPISSEDSEREALIAVREWPGGGGEVGQWIVNVSREAEVSEGESVPRGKNSSRRPSASAERTKEASGEVDDQAGRGRTQKNSESANAASPRGLDLLKRKTQRRRHARTRLEQGDSVSEISTDAGTRTEDVEYESSSNPMRCIPSDQEDSAGLPSTDVVPRGIPADAPRNDSWPKRMTSDEILETAAVLSETDDVVRAQEVCRRLRARVRDYKAIADTALNQRGDAADLLREISRLKVQLDRTERRTAYFQKANEVLQMRLDSLGEERWCELEDQLSQKDKALAQQQKELKDLRRVQRQQEKALKGESRQELAVQLQQLMEELRVLKEAYRDLKQTHRRDEETLKKKDKENASLQDRCSRLTDVVRGRDRADLKTSNSASEKEQQIQVLTRRLEMLARAKEADMRTHLRALRESATEMAREKERFAAVTEALVEKNKEVRLLNVKLQEYTRLERTLSPRMPRTSSTVASEQPLPAVQPRFPRVALETPHTKRIRRRSEDMLQLEPSAEDRPNFGSTVPTSQSGAYVTRIYGPKAAAANKPSEGAQWQATVARGMAQKEPASRLFNNGSKPERRRDLTRSLPPISFHASKENEKEKDFAGRSAGETWPRNASRHSTLEGSREVVLDARGANREQKKVEEEAERRSSGVWEREREGSQERRGDGETGKRDGESLSVQDSCQGSEGEKGGIGVVSGEEEAVWSSGCEDMKVHPSVVRRYSHAEQRVLEKGEGVGKEGSRRSPRGGRRLQQGETPEGKGRRMGGAGKSEAREIEGEEDYYVNVGSESETDVDVNLGMVEMRGEKVARHAVRKGSGVGSRVFGGGKGSRLSDWGTVRTSALRNLDQENVAPRARVLQGRGIVDKRVLD